MDKNNQKKPVNKLVLIILALLIVGGGVFAYLKNKAKNDALNSLTIDFVSNQTETGAIQLEYDLSKIDPLTLVTSHTWEIEASKSEIDLSVLGESEIEYILSTKDSMGGTVKKSFTKKIVVSDTKAPEISFDNDNIPMTAGSAIPDNNITVSDPVDGALELVENEPAKTAESGRVYEKGWYTVSHEIDPAKEGEYTVTITASDKNGNRTEKTYTVTVTKQKEQYRYVAREYYADEEKKWVTISAKQALSYVNDWIKNADKVKNKKRSKYTSLEQVVNDQLYCESAGDGTWKMYIFVYDSKGKQVKKHLCLKF